MAGLLTPTDSISDHLQPISVFCTRGRHASRILVCILCTPAFIPARLAIADGQFCSDYCAHFLIQCGRRELESFALRVSR